MSGIDACSLLTPDEIHTALDVAVNPGVEQDSDGQVDCEWSPQDETEAVSVGVTVATYDDVLWQNMAASDLAKPVSGFGEAAFSGYPHAGDLSIRQGGYMITIGIVDFRPDTARVDAADATFANLVLSRL